jgi:Ca2+/H+ antiporter, TMEM165/GDT1 family
MDWKIFFATFTAIFLAELADKNQLVGIGMSAKSGKPITVWIASVCGYAVVTIISVFLGKVFSNYLRPDLIKVAGGVLFLLIGILMLTGKL